MEELSVTCKLGISRNVRILIRRGNNQMGHCFLNIRVIYEKKAYTYKYVAPINLNTF